MVMSVIKNLTSLVKLEQLLAMLNLLSHSRSLTNPYLYWMTLSASLVVLSEGLWRATPHGSSVTTGGNRTIRRKPAMLGKVKLDKTLLTCGQGNYMKPEWKPSHSGERHTNYHCASNSQSDLLKSSKNTTRKCTATTCLKDILMAGSPYTSAEYNYQDAFRNLVCNVNRKLSFHSLREFNVCTKMKKLLSVLVVVIS